MLVASQTPGNIETNGFEFHNWQYVRFVLLLRSSLIANPRHLGTWEVNRFKMNANETSRGDGLLDGVLLDPMKLALIPFATIFFWYALQHFTSPLRKYPGPILGGKSSISPSD